MFIELDKINKFFGDYKALDNVSMYFRSGEIVGILGENGAGKTTLLNIVYGLYRPDSGIISIDGERLRYITPRYSVNKGIFLVQQFPRLIETMTGLENLVLLLNERREDVRKLLDEYSDRFKIYVDYNKKVSDMTLIERQKLYTLMSLIQNAKMILLDEPNTLLTNDLEYIDFLRRFSREHEGGVVICSHKIKAVLDISDRIYIMRRGRVLKEYKSVSKEYYDEILDIMFGHNSDTSTVYKSVEKSNRDKEISRVFSKDLFKTKDLVVRDDIGAIDLSVKRGEIVSIVTIAGRGDKELFNVLAGLTRPLKGSIIYDEEDITKKPTYERISRGILYIPDNRLEIINPRYKIRELLGLWKINSSGVVCIDKMNVVYRSLESQISELSGGNITRLLISIILCTKPHLVISHNIFNGLDQRGYTHALKIIRDLRQEHMSFLMILNDYEEALEISDRIYVLNEEGSKEISIEKARLEPKILWRELVS